jgi:ABC-type Fe3+-hydroxamate transport system substrate-binding protein
MQPNNEKITSIIDAASENLIRQVLPQLIEAGATPDQIASAARAIGMFKQSITGEPTIAIEYGDSPYDRVELLENQRQLVELAQEYEEAAENWEQEREQLLEANQELQEQLQKVVAPRNGHTPALDEEEVSPRDAARSRILKGRRRLSEKTGFGRR